MKKQYLDSQWVRIDTVVILGFLIYFTGLLTNLTPLLAKFISGIVIFVIFMLVYIYHIKPNNTFQTLRGLRK